MMDPQASREPARSLLHTPAARPAERKFGTHDAWAFDVPPWHEFFNTPRSAPQVPQLSYAAITDEFWMVAVEVGRNSGR